MKRDVSFLTQSLIAHRGYHNINEGIPENSIPAFKKAINNKLIIELDVHILKDGNIVVFHDSNLKRMTGIDKEIKDYNYDELKEVPLQDTKEHIPLFTDVLKLINGKVPIIVETKYDVKCGVLEKDLIEILKDYKGKYVIQSFNPFSLMYIKKHFPTALRGQLISSLNKSKIPLIKKITFGKMFFTIFTKPDYISCNRKILKNKTIKKFRKNNLVLGWTIRDKKEIINIQDYCDNYVCEGFKL